MLAKDKKQLNVSLRKNQISDLEKIAEKTGLTKSQLVALAISSLVAWDVGKDVGKAVIDHMTKKGERHTQP